MPPASDHPLEDTSSAPSEEYDMKMIPNKELTYHFLRLPYTVRMSIVHKLGLVSDDDEGHSSMEINALYFQRARKRVILHKLWEEVEASRGNREGDNPFEGR